jgi:heat shock protein HslJ
VRQPDAVSGVIVGGTGCNDYNATYTGNLNEIKVNLPVKTNNAGCAPGVSEQEGQYFLALNSATSYRILGDTLQIPYGDGQMLSFTAFVPEVPAPLSSLNGTRWWLVSMGNLALLSGSEITADFAINSDGLTGTISGSAGCNSYSAEIIDFFQLGPLSVTNKACSNPPGVMEQESTYLSMLSTANSISMAYNQLLIGTASGLLVYSNSPVPMAPAPTPIPASPTPTLQPAVPTVTPTLEPGSPSLPIATPPTPEVGSPSLPIATPAPVAVIIAPAAGTVATAITFDGSTSQPSGSITLYSWDFGDGLTGEGATISHAYTTAGAYTVTLTVTDSIGQTSTDTLQVTIK